MAPEKTEDLLVTHRRSFQYPKIALGEHEIEWKKSIKYLAHAQHWRTQGTTRRLVASLVNSKLLYAAPIWTSFVSVTKNFPLLPLDYSGQLEDRKAPDNSESFSPCLKF